MTRFRIYQNDAAARGSGAATRLLLFPNVKRNIQINNKYSSFYEHIQKDFKNLNSPGSHRLFSNIGNGRNREGEGKC
jgi:hypothetical protein